MADVCVQPSRQCQCWQYTFLQNHTLRRYGFTKISWLLIGYIWFCCCSWKMSDSLKKYILLWGKCPEFLSRISSLVAKNTDRKCPDFSSSISGFVASNPAGKYPRLPKLPCFVTSNKKNIFITKIFVCAAPNMAGKCPDFLLRTFYFVATNQDRKCPDFQSSLPVKSHSAIDTFCLPWRQRTKDTSTNVSCPKTFFLVNCLYTNNVLNAHVHV